MPPSQRQRVVVMLVLLAVFMAGLAVSNTVSELLGIAICFGVLVLCALYVARLNRRR